MGRRAVRRGPAIFVVALSVSVASITAAVALRSDPPPTSRPNIVVVMTDDQAVQLQWALGETNAMFAETGTDFSESFVTYPVCCPSRATYLTGQYTANHGVLANSGPSGGSPRLDQPNTLPVWLSDAGYVTSSIGKYLNGYGQMEPVYVPEGWDRWFGLIDPSTYRFWDYEVYDNGETVYFGEDDELYQTDVLAARAVTEIEELAAGEAPFFLSVTTVAPHSATGKGVTELFSPAPAPRHVGTFSDEPLFESPNMNEDDVTDKPTYVASREPLSESRQAFLESVYQQQAESLLAVDELVVDVVDALEAAGELDNTLFIYTSDNGYSLGQHRLGPGKVLPYEEIIRVPLLIRGPGFPAGAVVDRPVANIDLAPTILWAAKAEATVPIDGVPLQAVVEDEDFADRALLFEKPAVPPMDGPFPPYMAIRVNGWKYTEYGTGEVELYDLTADPFELENLAGQPDYVRQQRQLADGLDELARCAGTECSDIRVAVG